MQNKPVKQKITHWITNQHRTPLKEKITLRIVKANWLNVVLWIEKPKQWNTKSHSSRYTKQTSENYTQPKGQNKPVKHKITFRIDKEHTWSIKSHHREKKQTQRAKLHSGLTNNIREVSNHIPDRKNQRSAQNYTPDWQNNTDEIWNKKNQAKKQKRKTIAL